MKMERRQGDGNEREGVHSALIVRIIKRILHRFTMLPSG